MDTSRRRGISGPVEQMQPHEIVGDELPLGQLAGDETPDGRRQGMHPGDELRPNQPNAGENLCWSCGGSGTAAGGARCATCGGAGKVIASVSGGP